jgi:predicted MFS family arabinose efflux permease
VDSAVKTAPADREMAVSEIVRTGVFWKLAICFAIMGMSFYAIAPNIVYILTKKAGMGLGDVATIQAVSGIAVLFGRIGFGVLLDKIHAPIVGVISLALTAICARVYAATAIPGSG